jgi:hypothetical protein
VSFTPLGTDQHFGEKWLLRIHERRESTARNPSMSATCFRAEIFLGLFFDREDEGIIFYGKVG